MHTQSPANPESKTKAMWIPARGEEETAQLLDDIWITKGEKGRAIPYTNEYIYLGYLLHVSLKDDRAIRARITASNNLFGSMRKEILGAKATSTKVKKIVFVGMVLAMLLYVAEIWLISAEMERELCTCYRRWIRCMARVNRLNSRKLRLPSETLEQQLQVENMQHYTDQRMLGWAGHVARMDETRMPRKLLTSYADTKRKVGGQALTYGRMLSKAMKRKGIKNDWITVAKHRSFWRCQTQLSTQKNARRCCKNGAKLELLSKFGHFKKSREELQRQMAFWNCDFS